MAVLKNNRRNLVQLAADMAVNIVDTSTELKENEDALKSLLNNKIYENRYINESNTDSSLKRVRNILVIGAGASREANENLSLAADIQTHIERILKKENKKDLEKFQDECRTLKTNYNPVYFDFEYAMVALLKLDNGLDYAKRVLMHLYDYKYVSSLFYEIVGHMFKHRAIDVIINYNFDEILDNLIEEEMGKSDYHKIYFNGHCPNYQDILLGHRLYAPVYIKPHGTITHFGGLKYTRQSYDKNRNTPISKLISDLLNKNFIEYDNFSANKISLHTNIITVGYGFNDNDFKEMFTKRKYNSTNSYSFYCFDRLPEKIFKSKEYLKEILDNRKANDNFFYVEDPDIGQSFETLWKEVQKNFNVLDSFSNKIIPRNISRHQLMAKLFSGNKRDLFKYISFKYLLDNKNEADSLQQQNHQFKLYLEQKIVIELGLLIGKSEGIIHISQVKKSRAGKYMNIYFEKFGEDRNIKTYDKFIENFQKGLDRHMNYFIDTYRVKKAYWKNGLIDATEIFKDCNKILGLKGKIYDESLHLFKETCEIKLTSINPQYKKYHVSVFNNIKKGNLIYSDTRWVYKFRSLFNVDQEWNIILGIMETGSVFNNDFFKKEIKKKGARMAMLLADYGKEIATKVPECFRDKSLMISDPKNKNENINRTDLLLRMLPWWLHNNHMVLFLNIAEDGCILYAKGIFYTKRLLSNFVSPIFLDGVDNQENIKKLFMYFSHYWIKSGLYMRNQPESLLDKDYFEKKKKELIRSMYTVQYPFNKAAFERLCSFFQIL